jgi:hypothetical protein
MAEKIENRTSLGLRRLAAVVGDIIISRPPRWPAKDIAFHTTMSRLLLDDKGATPNQGYACKMANVSDEGFCVVCDETKLMSHPFKPGAQMTLEESDGKQSRVEVRWIKNGRLGLRRVALRPR